MAPKLEQAFTFRLFMDSQATLPMGSMKGGLHRTIFPFSSGFLKGADINAELVPGSADAFTLDPAAGVGYTDVRCQFKETDPAMGEIEAIFFMKYRGVAKLDEKIQLAFAGSPEAKTTKVEDHYVVANVVFEVSAERHKWMEQTLFIGQGHGYCPGDGTVAAEYEVYKVLWKSLAAPVFVRCCLRLS